MRVGSGKVSELVSLGQRPEQGSMRRRAGTHGHHTGYDHVYGEGQRGTFQPLLEPRRRTSKQPLTKESVSVQSSVCEDQQAERNQYWSLLNLFSSPLRLA